jgi:hypothetical protein
MTIVMVGLGQALGQLGWGAKDQLAGHGHDSLPFPLLDHVGREQLEVVCAKLRAHHPRRCGFRRTTPCERPSMIRFARRHSPMGLLTASCEIASTASGRTARRRSRRAALLGELQAAAQRGDPSVVAMSAGVGVGLIHSLDAAGEIIRRLVAETEQLLRDQPRALLPDEER